MLIVPVIDKGFVSEWAPQFDQAAHDYSEYEPILETVRDEISGSGTISEATFRRIYAWKSSRSLATVKWQKFNKIYQPRLRLAFSDSFPEHHKLRVLVWTEKKLRDKLPVLPHVLADIYGDAAGVRAPVASAVLHFAYPQKFPIIDVRTAEMLYFARRISSTERTDCQYDDFMAQILALAGESCSTIRELDKALFAFHYLRLQPAMNCLFQRMTNQQELSLTLDNPADFRRMIIDKIR